MTARFADTMHAAEAGFAKTDVKKGVALIEDWEKALKDVDAPGAKAIAHDLEALRKHLTAAKPDDAAIGNLVKKLGEATTKIAPKAETSKDKLKSLGEALAA